MAQTKTIQLLRSSQVYANLEAAKTGIQGAAGTRQDGELLLGRYWSGTGSSAVIKSVIGIYHKNPDLTTTETGTITAGWTFIQDITSSSEGLQHLQNEVNLIETALGFNDAGTKPDFDTKNQDVILASDDVVAAIQKVANAIAGMDKAADAKNGQVVTTVTQTNGAVTESKANVRDLQLGGYSKDANATGAIGSTDTVNTALSKLENTIAANAVDSSDDSITVTSSASGTDVIVNVDGTTIVKSTGGALKADLTLTALTSSELTDLSDSNVKEAYKMIYSTDTTNRTAIGSVIKIYKDSSLLSVALLHAQGSTKPTYNGNGSWTDVDSQYQTEANLALCFAYQLANGTTSVEAIPVGNFLRESEFKDGLVVNSTGEVRVLVDQNSESVITEYGATAAQNVTAPVLSVSSDGVKVSNIQNAIDAAVAHASADLAVTAQGDNYITAAQDATNNKKINVSADVQDLTATAGTPGVYNATTGEQTTAPVAGTLSGVANSLGDAADIATKVKTYVDGAIAIEAARSDAKNVADMKTVSDYTVNGKKISTNPVLDGSDILLTGYTQGTDTTDVVSTDSVNAAIAKLQNQITAVEGVDGSATASSATNVDTTPTADFKVLTKVVQTDSAVVETTVTGGSTAVTLKKLAATGAAADVTVADSGNKLTATNVEDALIEIVNKADASLNSVSSTNGAIAVGTKDSDKNQALTFQVSASCAKQGDGTANMLTIANDGLVLSDTWDCGTF